MPGLPPLQPPSIPITFDQEKGRPAQAFYQYLLSLDQIVRALSGFAAVIAAAGGLPAFSVTKNAVDQTGVVSATFTLITWSTELYDIGGFFAANGWTPPAGKISLYANAIYTGTITAGSQAGIAIFKNGVLFKQAIEAAITNAASGTVFIEDVANGTDVYTVDAFVTTSAGTATVQGAVTNTFFMGHWISP